MGKGADKAGGVVQGLNKIVFKKDALVNFDQTVPASINLEALSMPMSHLLNIKILTFHTNG